MNETMTVQGKEIQVKEYKGARVISFKDIDLVHERPEGTARKRFNDNRKRFISGVDFFQINQPSEIRTLGIERPQGGSPDKVTLITESGYLMLVKSFTDDLAWRVQRELVDCYFRAKQEPTNEEITVSLMEVENLIRCAEIMAGCLEGNKPYVLNILRHLVPNISELEPVSVKVDEMVVEIPVENSLTIVNKVAWGGNRKGYGIPFDSNKFNRYLIDNDVKVYWLQVEIGCSSGCISKWRYGESKPIEYYRNRICEALELPIGYFDKKKRR